MRERDAQLEEFKSMNGYSSRAIQTNLTTSMNSFVTRDASETYSAVVLYSCQRVRSSV